jgi:nucleoside-diphosphate-sugar epimerase
MTVDQVNQGSRKVLVTGGAGYVGARLVPSLIEAGYRVRVLDTCWYGTDVFGEFANNPMLELVVGDIRDRDTVKASVNGCTDVIHLACISNDPSYDLNPQLGEEINFTAFEPLVQAAKSAGVSRFVYASSSSVYGVKEEERVTEDLPLDPLTDYSKYKAMCEPILLDEASEDFVATVIRPATLCGYSPRQRLDLTVNIITNNAVNEQVIRVFGGDQYRPNLHIEDMCRAYLEVLQQPASKVNGQVFNVGADNMKVSEIASIVAAHVDGPVDVRIEPTQDPRSYRISSERIAEAIGFRPKFTINDAVVDLQRAFASGQLPNSLTDSKYFNIRRMNEILNATDSDGDT